RLLERDWVRRADPQRGRFRTCLLTLLTRFLSDQGPGRAPRQHAFEQQVVSVGDLVGDAERSYEPPAGETPEAVFLKQWAAALVRDVLQRLRQLYQDEGHAVRYDLFAAVHYPADPAERPSQQALAERFGVTRDQVRYALNQAEGQFASLLRAEVRGQV